MMLLYHRGKPFSSGLTIVDSYAVIVEFVGSNVLSALPFNGVAR